MISIKNHTSDPLTEIISAARRIYPKAKVDPEDSEDQKRLVQMCIRNYELSVFTHAYAQVEITCSWCVVQELLSNDFDLTVKSYAVNGKGLSYITPPSVVNDDQLKSIFTKFIKKINCSIKEFSKVRKKIDYRYILPGCVQTEILISTNFLEWLRILKLQRFSRTSDELKEILIILCQELGKICPEVFNIPNLKWKSLKT